MVFATSLMVFVCLYGLYHYKTLPHLASRMDMNLALHSAEPIMGYMGNDTAKAELGRVTWRYFHTVMARFPEKPVQEERDILFTFVHLFAKLYPCGECAKHFSELLEKYPPQTSGRSAASQWACHVHNKVNEHLSKDSFDCSRVESVYDCGCNESSSAMEDSSVTPAPVSQSSAPQVFGTLETEGLTRGG